MVELESLFKALDFAAQQHIFQRRKGSFNIPYINHPIRVSYLLIQCGETDVELLSAALLHDVIEDTQATAEEIASMFGEKVASIVSEVTDNMQLSKEDRKRLQIEKAPFLSRPAKLIKIADKACNMEDLIRYPIWWPKSRKIAYFQWAYAVFVHCKGLNPTLDKYFLDVYKRGLNLWNIEINE
ncbi:MAG: HD domain-containing protein [Bacteroidales bacterium]|nr:HD domain-containing protein [Bacteroidales bacterium]